MFTHDVCVLIKSSGYLVKVGELIIMPEVNWLLIYTEAEEENCGDWPFWKHRLEDQGDPFYNISPIKDASIWWQINFNIYSCVVSIEKDLLFQLSLKMFFWCDDIHIIQQ